MGEVPGLWVEWDWWDGWEGQVGGAEHALQDRPAHLWVFAGNHRAEACYAKLGFSPDGGRMTDPDTSLLELRWSRAGPRRSGSGDGSGRSR